jgi:hypothetical protein
MLDINTAFRHHRDDQLDRLEFGGLRGVAVRTKSRRRRQRSRGWRRIVSWRNRV